MTEEEPAGPPLGLPGSMATTPKRFTFGPGCTSPADRLEQPKRAEAPYRGHSPSRVKPKQDLHVPGNTLPSIIDVDADIGSMSTRALEARRYILEQELSRVDEILYLRQQREHKAHIQRQKEIAAADSRSEADGVLDGSFGSTVRGREFGGRGQSPRAPIGASPGRVPLLKASGIVRSNDRHESVRRDDESRRRSRSPRSLTQFADGQQQELMMLSLDEEASYDDEHREAANMANSLRTAAMALLGNRPVEAADTSYFSPSAGGNSRYPQSATTGRQSPISDIGSYSRPPSVGVSHHHHHNHHQPTSPRSIGGDFSSPSPPPPARLSLGISQPAASLHQPEQQQPQLIVTAPSFYRPSQERGGFESPSDILYPAQQDGILRELNQLRRRREEQKYGGGN